MKKNQILNSIGAILTILATLLMFCIAGGLDADTLTIKRAVILALLDFNLFGVATVLASYAKGGNI